MARKKEMETKMLDCYTVQDNGSSPIKDVNIVGGKVITDTATCTIKISTEHDVRKIIDGLLYDTTNAEKILSEDGATYYATQNRRFFCEMCGDITAISFDDMKKIVSTIGNVDLYEKYIGKVEKA